MQGSGLHFSVKLKPLYVKSVIKAVVISYQTAIDLVAKLSPGPKGTERCALSKTRGRVLAETVVSDVSVPPFDKAMMDGFAIRSSDIIRVPSTLNVVADIPAGYLSDITIRNGEAASIMTGAPVPRGADAVVKVEETSGFGAPSVTLYKNPRPGENISREGNIVGIGEQVLSPGVRIGSEEAALLAMAGCDPTPVFERPQIAILATGDELVPPNRPPGPAEIRNTNSAAMTAFVSAWGISPLDLGCVGDSPEEIEAAVKQGLEADILLLSGGVSAGAYDFVKEVLTSLGVTIHFDKIRVKPGKPTVFGTRNGVTVLGLPGNPVSAGVIARLFAATIIDKQCGLTRRGPRTIVAELANDIKKTPERLWFVPGRLEFHEKMRVTAIRNNGSADLVAAARANALIMAREGVRHIPAGEQVRVVVWERAF